MTPSLLARLMAVLPPALKRHKVLQCAVRLFPGQRIATFRFNRTALITADLADSAARQALITGIFEPEFFSIAAPFLIPGSAVFDVGANNGFCTFGLAAGRSAGDRISFHLFEANRHLCETLELSGRLYPSQSIFVNQACVSDQPGSSMLQVVDGHWGGSYISQEENSSQKAKGQKVDNIVLDDYLRQKQISTFSFLKMDIEGYEMHALRGLVEGIRSGSVGAMYIECSGENLQRQGANPAAMLRLLRDLGCGIFWCKEQDFAAGRASGIREVFPTAGSPAVRLAPVKEFPADHQTDIIAIPSTGPHRHLLDAFEFPQ